PAPVTETAALAVANKLRASLVAPFAVQGLRLHVDASIGISLYPTHGDTGVELLRLADVALYQAKRARSGSEIYDPSRDKHSREHLSLANERKEALADDEISVYFQPKTHVESGEVIGLEALARWNHPTHGPVPPSTFVPVAEQ